MTIQAISLETKETQAVQGQPVAWAQRLVGAIKAASKSTGVDFAYLMNKAAQESGFKADAKAKTSSATGLYQFTEQTWLKMVKQYGDKQGMGVLADQITLRADGYATVKDPSMRRQILAMRKNPEMSAVMAAELAQENKSYLQNEIGGDIGNTDLYMAHFLGAYGAARFIQATRSDPHSQAAELLPEAAAANKNVFYDGTGKPLTVAQIYDRFAAKMDGKGVTVPNDVTPTMVAELGKTLSRVPDLRLPANDTQISYAAPSAVPMTVAGSTQMSNAGPNLGMSVAPESLYSVMVLAQLDAPNFSGTREDKNPNARADRNDKDVTLPSMLG